MISIGNSTPAENLLCKVCILAILKTGIYHLTLMVLLNGQTRELTFLRTGDIIALMTEDLLLIAEIPSFQDRPPPGGSVANKKRNRLKPIQLLRDLFFAF